MDTEKIRAKLTERFSGPLEPLYKRRIIFWYDPNGEFQETVDGLDIDDVKILKIEKNRKGRLNNIFQIKYTLECEDTASNYLVYSPEARPKEKENNWLLDIELYSEDFSADKTSMLIDEFGFDKGYRELIEKYADFFNNKERKKKLDDILPENPAAQNIELGIMAVLSKTSVLNFETVLRNIFMNGLEDNKYYSEIEKYCGNELFWTFIEREFELALEKKELKRLLYTFLCTHMFYTIRGEIPLNLQKYVAGNKQNLYIFVDHWLNDKKDSRTFLEMSKAAERELNISSYLGELDLEKLISVNTFKAVDSFVIDSIAAALVGGLEEFDTYKEWISLRRDISSWNAEFRDIYRALAMAVDMAKYEKYFHIKEYDKDELFEAYLKKYSGIDRTYRKFYEYYDRTKTLNTEKLEKIKERVEGFYLKKYQVSLGQLWTQCLLNMKENYSLVNYGKQLDFYRNHIEKMDERVFVIISDALRYEVATELGEKLLARLNANSVDLDAMLGCVPSYTRLGMAALLPHNGNLEYKDGAILIDGIDSSGTQGRESILKAKNPESVAVQFDDLVKKMSRAEARELIKGKEVVYIYHNRIDAVGDKRSTEIDVFNGCRTAIEEIIDGVKFLTNTFSASNIFITADHGFLYQRENVEAYEKLELNDVEVLGNSNKRFVYVDKEISKDGTLVFDMDNIFKGQNMKALVPKDMLRFKSAGGGVNYVHGGASLQEITVPLIKYKHYRNKQYELSKTDIEFINLSRKIRNNVTKFKFIQVHGVDETKKILARIIKVGIYDGNTLISNERTHKVDASDEETYFEISLTLKKGDYDRNKDYFLRVVDIESDDILINEAFKIDIGIVNEFDF